MVDADDELGVGYGHGVLICGSFTTAGDARLMLEEKVNPDLKKPKSERVFQEAVEPEPRKDQDEADLDFESDANPDFDINDFGSVGPDLLKMKMKMLMLPKLSMRMLHLLKICGNRIYAWR